MPSFSLCYKGHSVIEYQSIALICLACLTKIKLKTFKNPSFYLKSQNHFLLTQDHKKKHTFSLKAHRTQVQKNIRKSVFTVESEPC